MTWNHPALILLALAVGVVIGLGLGLLSRRWDWNDALRRGREECQSHHTDRQ